MAALPVVGGLLDKWLGNRAARDKFQADHRSANYQQFAAEFGHATTWWDSLIDGLNRLPRPIMTFGTIYIFWLCWRNPEEFIEGAIALQAMPKEGWYILGAVVTFWFAAKLPKDFGKYKIQKGAIDIAKTVTEVRANREAFTKDVSVPLEQTEHEEVSWEQRKTNRYKTDWSNLND